MFFYQKRIIFQQKRQLLSPRHTLCACGQHLSLSPPAH
ncbi:hypothetical protein C3B79_3328 [Aeromonas hydrophila]|nr:hypothetical protein C3B79_3328 [Aeromonas hydrophila]